MARSFDKRRHPAGPIAGPDNLSTMRGRKRKVVGRVTPGDDIEVSREIERLWAWIGRLQRRTTTTTSVPTGPGGPVQYGGDLDLATFIQNLGATAYYKFAESAPSTADGTTADHYADSSGYSPLVDLDHINVKTGTYNVWYATDTDSHAVVYNDDGAARLNTEIDTVFLGTFQGAYMSPKAGGGLGASEAAKFEPSGGDLSIIAYVKPQACVVSGHIGQIMGWYGTYDGGSTESGTGLLWDADLSAFVFRNKMGGVTNSIVESVAADEWYHVALVLDSGTWHFYLNGVPIGSMTPASLGPTSADEFKIGTAWFDFGVSNRYGYWEGSIDELAFFSGVVLTPDDIVNVQLVAQSDPSIGYVSGPLNGSTALNDHSVTLDKLFPADEEGQIIRMGTTDAEWASTAIEVTSTGALKMTEQTDPAAPATNNALLYTKDNGAGKTQLVARFPTGAVQVIATEP